MPFEIAHCFASDALGRDCRFFAGFVAALFASALATPGVELFFVGIAVLVPVRATVGCRLSNLGRRLELGSSDTGSC